ncbi:Gamma-aminobutyric acid receptor subunit pi [Aphelenchoides fujianensis]|nr:Gamma-aminobutyric acid receptor subunit pi [Aphelenchoides fujianensis]
MAAWRALIWILWAANWAAECRHSSAHSKRQLHVHEPPLNDRQIIDSLLKTYRFPEVGANISVGVSLFVERILEANEDLAIDYLWSPSLAVENALSVLPVGKQMISVLSNGIVEYVQRVQVLVQAETDLRNFPFETRNCTFHFSNDDSRAVWSRLLGVESSPSAQTGVSGWKLIGTRTDGRSLHLFLRRSINRFILTLFLPSLGLLLVGWFSSWFFAAEDRRRLYANVIAMIGIVFVIIVNESYTPQTGFLKAVDLWCLGHSFGFLFEPLARDHFERQRNSYDPDSEKARWIVADTPYYSQLGIDHNYTVALCKCCLSSLASMSITLVFGFFVVYFGVHYVLPYYKHKNWTEE